MEDTWNTFTLRVIGPESVFFEGQAHMAEIRTQEGTIGVLKGHIPLTALLRPGTIRIRQGEAVKEAVLSEGFAEVLPDRVTILTRGCKWTRNGE